MEGANSQMDAVSQRELQEFLQVEQQRAKFQGQISNLTDKCWENCVGKPGTKLSGGEQSCISNCVNR